MKFRDLEFKSGLTRAENAAVLNLLRAADEYAFMGSQDPADWEAIEGKYVNAVERLCRVIAKTKQEVA